MPKRYRERYTLNGTSAPSIRQRQGQPGPSPTGMMEGVAGARLSSRRSAQSPSGRGINIKLTGSAAATAQPGMGRKRKAYKPQVKMATAKPATPVVTRMKGMTG